MFSTIFGAAPAPAPPLEIESAPVSSKVSVATTRRRVFATSADRGAKAEGSIKAQILDKYDTNHDGIFSRAEVEVIVDDVLAARKAATYYRKLFIGSLLAILFMSAAIFAVVICAITLTKDAFVAPATGVQSARDGTPVRTASGLVASGINMHSDTRRRLLERTHADGRQLLETGDLPFETYARLLAIGEATGVLTGSAKVEAKAEDNGRRRLAETATKTNMYSGGVESQTTDKDGTIYYQLYDNKYPVTTIVVVAADNSSVKLTAVATPVGNSSRRLTALSADESREHRRLGEELRRRRLAEVAGDAALELQTDNVRDPTGDCLAYHCFAGDDDCDEPATRDMCAEWSDRPRRMAASKFVGIVDENRRRLTHTVVPLGSKSPEHVKTCFPATATVRTRAGPLPIGELRVGDEVLVDGGAYSAVHLLGHLDHSAVSREFVRIELSSGHALEMTARHFAVVFDEATSRRSHVAAEDVRVGQSMLVVGEPSSSEDGPLSAARVVEIKRVRRAGLFAPVTLDGNLVVDGVVASSYSDVMGQVSPRLRGPVGVHVAHALLAPLRFMYAHHPAQYVRLMAQAPHDPRDGALKPFNLDGEGGFLSIVSTCFETMSLSDAPSVTQGLMAIAAELALIGIGGVLNAYVQVSRALSAAARALVHGNRAGAAMATEAFAATTACA